MTLHVFSRTRQAAALRSRLTYRFGSVRFASVASRDLWRSVNAVCFDVDSTVCEEEGIDVLAAYCGAGAAVKEWTTRAMNGGVKFEDALAARLDLIKPSKNAIQSCLLDHPPILTKGIKQLVSTLHARNIEVFLVSGGFRLMIEPVAHQLNIPRRNIFANTIFFNEKGEYSGFDDTELTSRDGGKAKALSVIKKTHGHDIIAMVGDGATDMQARPPADLLIGYGGVVVRPIVQQHADWFVTDFTHLTNALLKQQ